MGFEIVWKGFGAPILILKNDEDQAIPTTEHNHDGWCHFLGLYV